MGDFNIDLLKYDTEKDSADFLDSMYASFLLPYIGTPSQVTVNALKPLLIIYFLIISKMAVFQVILHQQSLITMLSFFYCKILIIKVQQSNKQ